jgi:spermidine synthase
MIPWRLLDCAQVPDGEGELRLYARGDEFSIRVGRTELMNSRVYASEDALSEIGCARVRDRARARVLIGGLGMGYSLRTALAALGPDAEVVVAELVPAVVTWNREQLGHLAGHPLRDPRVRLREADVARVIAEQRSAYDAILLDVDNGPDGLTRKGNDRLYGATGLARARDALRPRGVLGVWSQGPDDAFVRRMQRANLEVEQINVTARGHGRGARHTIWLAKTKQARG